VSFGREKTIILVVLLVMLASAARSTIFFDVCCHTFPPKMLFDAFGGAINTSM
jgi:hypothetical protein